MLFLLKFLQQFKLLSHFSLVALLLFVAVFRVDLLMCVERKHVFMYLVAWFIPDILFNLFGLCLLLLIPG